MYEQKISINDVIAVFIEKHGDSNSKSIRKAYEFAALKHMGMKRGTGEPYIHHPLRVAHSLAEWGFDTEVISAALLHDVVEDCQTELSEIKASFGTETAEIVDAVTSLSDRDFTDHTLTKTQKDILSDAALQRKMNEKALYVKIADRIDNLSTLNGVPEEKRIPKAIHTREIIIPMALLEHAYRHVGQLEELCFQTEHPQKYETIRKCADKICDENSRTCTRTIETMKELFSPQCPMEHSVLARYQHYFKTLTYERRSCVSIFRQIITEADNIKYDCEAVLTKERYAFYDLTLILSDRILEVKDGLPPFQLFFLYFENLLSAKGLYLLGYENATHGDEVYLNLADAMDNKYRLFIRTETEQNRYLYGDIIDSKGSFSIKDVNEIAPAETYNQKIRVYSKDGTALMIDKDATVLDFAFYIHTDLGFHFDYAMIDESKTRLPPYTRLNAGDMITIVSNDSIRPSITWFNYIKTRRAVHHLVDYFQNQINEKR